MTFKSRRDRGYNFALKTSRLASVIVMTIISLQADADNTCIDSFSYGESILRSSPFPTGWLVIGSKPMTDPSFNLELKRILGRDFALNADGRGFACIRDSSVYIVVSTSEASRSFVEFRTTAPKCSHCSAKDGTSIALASLSGLVIGQTKDRVGEKLGQRITADSSTVMFEEVESGKKYHTQMLHLEFDGDRLRRFSIMDSREGL